jgi:hypothetical protein
MRRFVVTVLHPALLLAGALFATSGVVVALQRYRAELATNGADWWRFGGWYILSHAGTGIALLLLTFAYGAAYWRRQLRAWAPLAYLLSYGVCGLAFLIILESAGKADQWSEAEYTLTLGGLTFILPALLISIAGLVWTTKRSAAPD